MQFMGFTRLRVFAYCSVMFTFLNLFGDVAVLVDVVG